jgi:16S rRNA (cytosine967-C5)-methyltransferase
MIRVKNKDNARKRALEILIRLEMGDSNLDTLMQERLEGLSTLDRAFTMELVYGVLRWRLKIDWIIDLYSKINTRKLEYLVLGVLRLGIYQLLFLNRVPTHAAIDESTKLLKVPIGKEEKKAGFVNAILRKVDRERKGIIFPNIKNEPVKYLSVVYSHPEWIIERWLKRYGIKETIALCQSDNKVPPTTLRTNTLRTTREKLLESLRNDGVRAEITRFSPLGIEITESHGPSSLLPTSDLYIQDEASQLIPYLLNPRPGEVILDACASPGGKTTQIVQLMENRGMVYAMDVNPNRVRLIKEICKRLGAEIVSAVEGDATKDIVFKPKGGFDGILLDAPCTGLGVLGRNPDIRYKRKEEDIKRLSVLQLRMIQNLSRYLREGGRLIYSTCTLEPEENERVIEGFLKSHKGFIIEDAADFLPGNCKALTDENGFLRTFPPRDGMDGFFAARIKKLVQ